MLRDVITIAGGIGGLVFLYLVLTNASSFSTITNSIAGSTAGLVTVLQGRGGGSFNAGGGL